MPNKKVTYLANDQRHESVMTEEAAVRFQKQLAACWITHKIILIEDTTLPAQNA